MKYSKKQISNAVGYWENKLVELNENRSESAYANCLWFHFSFSKINRMLPPAPSNPFFIGDNLWCNDFDDETRCYIFKLDASAQVFDITSAAAWKKAGFPDDMASLFRAFECMFNLFPEAFAGSGESDRLPDRYFHEYEKSIVPQQYDFLSSIELRDMFLDSMKTGKAYRQYSVDNYDLKSDFAECAEKCGITADRLFNCLKSIYEKSCGYSYKEYVSKLDRNGTTYTCFFWFVMLSEIAKAGFSMCTGKLRDEMEERVIISTDAMDIVNLREYTPDASFEKAANEINTPKYDGMSFVEKLKIFNGMLKK